MSNGIVQPLTRKELGEFLPSTRAITTFERLITNANAKYSAMYSRTTSFTPSSANTAYPVTLDRTDFQNGFYTDDNKIVAQFDGIYGINITTRIKSTSGTPITSIIWLRKNGVDEQKTASGIAVPGANTISCNNSESIMSLLAGDYIELMFAVTSTGPSLQIVSSTSFSPLSSAATMVITTISQQGQNQ